MENEESPCNICKKNKEETFFLTKLPCSHQVCLNCLSQIKDKRCPFCREDYGIYLRELCPKVSFEGENQNSIWDNQSSALEHIIEYQSPRNQEERISREMFTNDFIHMEVWNRMYELGL